ncbi:MAG: aminoacyl-histidine dipeptidase [Bacteroidales bacterium]|nr:aminoacyl-histidine dipeptidase [Bacteroidales bacterium]
MVIFAELEPAGVWKYFEEILAIPRPSKHEGKIIAYLIDFAMSNGLEWKKDAIGNLLIRKPASKGFENKETVVLQSHVDMVCEKNTSIEFDFLNDAIRAHIEDGWVKAKGTTLGADNGIGIAASLAVLTDNTLKHGEIECLFTVDEESGLTGAFNLESDFFRGKYLINLDSEDDGELFIGCAGGIDTLISCPVEIEQIPETGYEAFLIKVSGLKGGHSGDDINKGRGNANKILVRFLWQALDRFNLKISSLEGGNLRNAIPREASSLVIVKDYLKQEFIDYLKKIGDEIYVELQPVETEFKLTCQSQELPGEVFSEETINPVISAVYTATNGVIEMSRTIPGFVETSSNLASIRMVDKRVIHIVTSQRSSVESSKLHIAGRIRSLFELIGAKVEHTGSYPGWKPNPESVLLHITESQHIELFGNKPLIRAIHAGLECGLFLVKYPYLDMISFGPTIRDAHSPDEKMEIKTVKKFWDLLLAVIQKIPEK